jgi:predicted transcriptional regulator
MAPPLTTRLALPDCHASDLMSTDVASIDRRTTFEEALSLFIERNVTVAPVVGDLGEPVGVLSVTDLLIHVRAANSNRIVPATAESMMTPTIFTVPAEMSASEVVRDMLRSRVHHLFVEDSRGKIAGVISTCDVLRRLQDCEDAAGTARSS